MENKSAEGRIEECLKLLGDIKAKVGDERTALTILQEVKKDMRCAQIHDERKNGNGNSTWSETGINFPATQSQVNFLRRLGVEVPEDLTKEAASKLIDEAKEKKEKEREEN